MGKSTLIEYLPDFFVYKNRQISFDIRKSEITKRVLYGFSYVTAYSCVCGFFNFIKMTEMENILIQPSDPSYLRSPANRKKKRREYQ